MSIDKVCRDCGKSFSISPQEQDWIASKGFKLYTRCKECRRQNRLKNDDENSSQQKLSYEAIKAALLAASAEIINLKADLAFLKGERDAALHDLQEISIKRNLCQSTCANYTQVCLDEEDHCVGYKWRGVLKGENA